jgi:tRNA 2-selenouridine synthase
MKDFTSISAAEALAKSTSQQIIIDVRSPSEFALDRFPQSVNYPVLSDEERVVIGTLDKQVSSFEAKKAGAALVARNIANILETKLAHLKRQEKILIYCWRGGNRSGSLATVLSRIGYSVQTIDGGYRAYRREIIDQLNTLAANFQYKVIVGRTGSGKSLVLQALKTLGVQVLDLEDIARHKGSVLGLAPGDVQPSQKQFESLVWAALNEFDASKPIYIESESKKIGQCQVPEKLIECMRLSSCIDLNASIETRVALLKLQYPHFVASVSTLQTRLEALIALHGHGKVDDWKAMADQARWDELVADLLAFHYDPAYDRSIRRNFKRYEEAQRIDWMFEQATSSSLQAQEKMATAIRECATAILQLSEPSTC